MKKDLNPNVIRQKFQTLIDMDEQQKVKHQKKKSILTANEIALSRSKQVIYKVFQQTQKDQQKQLQNRFKEVIYTKGDIVKQISKLKPYLNEQKEELTTVQVQNLQSKKMSADEKKKLSNVIIYLNKRLCQKLREQATLQKQFRSDRLQKQKQGWIYEVFYRSNENIKAQLANTQFKSGYAVLTTIVQLYENLTFNNRLAKFNISQVKRVKYTSEKEYQIIDIRYEGGTLQLGFLSDQKLQLFDRMLFLLKNMARTSNSRLFQNQLIKTLYAEY